MTETKKYVQMDLFGNIPEVIVDVHEIQNQKRTSITLFIDFIKSHKINYKIQKLEVGDIILPNEYAIERKSVRDFLNSLKGSKNGRVRLMEQMKELVNTYSNPILLLEGGLSVRLDVQDKAIFIPIRKKKIRKRIYSVIEERIGVHPNAFLGAIKAIENLGVRVIKSYDPLHGAQLLWDLYLEAKRGPREERGSDLREYAIIRQKPKLKGLREQQIFFLCGLPGISYARAVKILRTYRTPYNAISKVRRWDIDIEGIGEATLSKVEKILFTEFPEKE